MSGKFRELLETRIREESSDRAAAFIESRNDSVHEVGISRGYLMALKDVLGWSIEIERKLNNE